MAVIIQLRHDTAANWSSTNPILADGETGYDSTNNNFRVGDGVTAWNSLVPTAGGGGSQDLADVLTQGNDAGGAKIINLDDPDNPQDAVTKAYADTAVGTVATNLSNHISDSSDAHAASAITNTPAGSIAATTIQAAVDELDGDIQGHISDTTAAHAASAVSFIATGGISATNVQAAIAELDTEKAPLASPAFTGNPTAPTPSSGDNDTSIATTGFVTDAVNVALQGDFVTLTDAAPVVVNCLTAREPKFYLETSSSRTLDLQNLRGDSVANAYSFITFIIKKGTASDIVITLDSGFTNRDITTDAVVTGYTLSGAVDKYFKITALVYGQGSAAIIWWNLIVQSSLTVIVPVYASTTLTVDAQSQEDTIHEYLTDITVNSTIAFSNVGNARIIYLSAYVNGTNIELTMPSSVVSSDSRYNNTTRKLIISGTSTIKLYSFSFLKVGSVYSMVVGYASPIS